MTLPRIVEDETLDALAGDDPDAMRSRRDLQRVHRFMGTVSIVSRALRKIDALRRPGPLRILELGAGDGTLMQRVAHALGPVTAPVELTLLDRIALVDERTLVTYAQAGWRARTVKIDVLEWAAEATAPPPATAGRRPWDLIVANLFLHHFEGAALSSILRAVALRGDRFFACEPRRSRAALVAASLTGLIGANAVTRNDAVLSVHAGFAGSELRSAWGSAGDDWVLDEYEAGPFSHCLAARRQGIA